MRRVGLLLALGCFVLTLAPQGVDAQQVLGTIKGHVTDESGASLPGVTVVVRNEDTGVERTVYTNETGFYAARSIPASSYSVTASLEGMQSVRRENIKLLVAQQLDVNIALQVGAVEEAITVTSESPLIEVSRSSAAAYVGEQEIAALPISGRDFTEFAFLTPTVQRDNDRGFITMSGQRGIYSGLNIDGTSAKSAFFGYGRGGEATENDGLVIAQDSVKEFQVITNGFAPEYGANGGGYVNVITQSGTNEYRGSAFLFYRDDSMAEDLPSTELDDFRGVDGSSPVDEFERQNWGASFGGPIVRDRTHFYLSYDQTSRDEPFERDLDTVGAYDAILQRAQTQPEFATLVDGFSRNADGTASGNFTRAIDNLILFGKIDHQFNAGNSGTFRVNLTDYEQSSGYLDEESSKLEDTLSIVGSLVSVIGNDKINEVRAQISTDELDRLSGRVGQPIEAQIRFRDRGEGRGAVGKFDFLPIFVEEDKLQFQESFSYLFGNHDLKFGIDYQEDALSQLFAGSADGRYDFANVQAFLDNDATQVRIWFGPVTNPNYDETQSLLGVYAQDSWKVNDDLTINYGLRWGRTDNPGDLAHIFPEGRDIPDDDDNWAPRFGFAKALRDGQDVVRGGVGLFYGRTPSLLFANQVTGNGLFPNFGRVTVGPDEVGFVPLGQPIDNTNPPADAPNAPGYVDPDFEDPETLRLNLGYERSLNNIWSAGVDLVWAEGDKLQSNVDINRTLLGNDQFGRPVFADNRPQAAFNEIFTRQSVGESEYTALTLKVNRRFSGRYQMQAHYTWSEDEDTDSNERSATGVTVSRAGFDTNGNLVIDPSYDKGLSDRDVENRFVVSGMVDLPYGFRVSGIFEYKDGTPFTVIDPAFNAQNFPADNGPDARAFANGRLFGRNTERNDSITKVDIRTSKLFRFGDYEVELFAEVFNLFDDNTFNVDGDEAAILNEDGTPNAEFGLGDNLITTPRQYQLGARFRF